MITKSKEEYLKTIYVLKIKTGTSKVTDIAKIMNCTKPSVNKAINTLKDEGYLDYKAYGDIILTKKGEDLAKKILKTYDIVYLFLKDVLTLDEEDAKCEAESIKSSMSDKTINSLAKHVYKVLNLGNLECDYDVSKERCRVCKRSSAF